MRNSERDTRTNTKNTSHTNNINFDSFMVMNEEIIALPKIFHVSNCDSAEWRNTVRLDARLQALNHFLEESEDVQQILYSTESIEAAKEEAAETLDKVIESYYSLYNQGCTEAGINLLSVIFPIYHNELEYGKILKDEYRGILKETYTNILNSLLVSGHDAGLFFMALHLLCIGDDDYIGSELLHMLKERNNQFATKMMATQCKATVKHSTEHTENEEEAEHAKQESYDLLFASLW